MLKKYGIYLAIFVVCFAIGIKTALDTPLGRNTLEMKLTSSKTGLSEVFYDDGLGFAAEKRVSQELLEEGVKTKLVFDLPQEPLVHLRWDPVYSDEGVATTVHDVKITFYGGEYEETIAFETIVPTKDIKTFKIEKEDFYFEVESGSSDPILMLTKIPELPEAPSRTWIMVKGVLFSALATLIFSAIYRLIVWYFNS